MIEYINKNNIDDRILLKAKEILEDGGLVGFPSDTSWTIGCSVLSKTGIEKLRKLKGDFQNYTLTMTCSNISQISDVAKLNNVNFRIVKQHTPGPYVFILEAQKNIEKKVNMKRIEVGVRIPDHPVPIQIVEILGNPIFSITASRALNNREWWSPEYAEELLYECGWELENIDEIDLILDTGETLPKQLTSVVRLSDDAVEVIREGIGKIDF